ncbi:unnamed protein product [Blepharisma stoltei]|uniref:DUF4430 domain-containing protein n=1 Tax=Blepharisma stoltei TaxID=1481888 RepID=A0AAU9IK68_9CILI|nr:unnamed protein product [Blepharisma stoltei]
MGSSSSVSSQVEMQEKQKSTVKLPYEDDFIIQIQLPNKGDCYEYKYPAFKDKISFTTLMNLLCFETEFDEELDSNFISRYNKSKDRFEYFVQKLMGIETEDETSPYKGKMWVVYINNSQWDWDEICEKDLNIKIKDKIVWKYQKCNNK